MLTTSDCDLIGPASADSQLIYKVLSQAVSAMPQRPSREYVIAETSVKDIRLSVVFPLTCSGTSTVSNRVDGSSCFCVTNKDNECSHTSASRLSLPVPLYLLQAIAVAMASFVFVGLLQRWSMVLAIPHSPSTGLIDNIQTVHPP